MFDKVTFNGKEIIESGHFKNELYNVYKKNLDLIFKILEGGTHTKESKEKVRVEKQTKGGRWELRVLSDHTRTASKESLAGQQVLNCDSLFM